MWAVWYPLGCSIDWLSVPIFTLVCMVAFARVVGGSLFLCPGCGLALYLVGMLVGMLVCPIWGLPTGGML